MFVFCVCVDVNVLFNANFLYPGSFTFLCISWMFRKNNYLPLKIGYVLSQMTPSVPVVLIQVVISTAKSSFVHMEALLSTRWNCKVTNGALMVSWTS